MSAVNRSFSASEPSHQTILAGFVRRAESSTQLSNGVDTLPPGILLRELCSTRASFLARLRKKQTHSNRKSKKFKARRSELQGARGKETGRKCWMLYFRRNVRAKTDRGDDYRQRAAAGAARLARQFLHAKFHGLGGIRRYAAERRRSARGRAERRSSAAGRSHERMVHQTRKRQRRGGCGGA